MHLNSLVLFCITSRFVLTLRILIQAVRYALFWVMAYLLCDEQCTVILFHYIVHVVLWTWYKPNVPYRNTKICNRTSQVNNSYLSDPLPWVSSAYFQTLPRNDFHELTLIHQYQDHFIPLTCLHTQMLAKGSKAIRRNWTKILEEKQMRDCKIQWVFTDWKKYDKRGCV